MNLKTHQLPIPWKRSVGKKPPNTQIQQRRAEKKYIYMYIKNNSVNEVFKLRSLSLDKWGRMNLNYILLLLHVTQTRMGIQEGYLQCPSIPPAPLKAAYFSRTALHQAPCINNMTDVHAGDLPVWKAKSHSTAKAGGKSRVKGTGTSSPPASLPRLFIITAWDTLCSRVQNSSSGDFCSFSHLPSL